MADRISSLDSGYVSGDLSVYPEAIDSKDTLYDAKNNAETVLAHSLSYNSNFIIVEDVSKFPDKGIIRVGEELIYYSAKQTGVFKDLVRGFAGSKHGQWSKGTSVKHAVTAEPHNACKDAILNIETFLGTKDNPDAESFNGKLKAKEKKFLAPNPKFKGFPRKGSPPLTVRFQNFSNKEAVRFLWDFGDGSTSTEANPTHEYVTEGEFTVQLRMITSLGGQGIVTKKAYVKVSEDYGFAFMYATPEIGTTATTFTFVDQTLGNIIQRYWDFGDGTRVVEDDPDIHTATHTYTEPGTYDPTLLVVFSDQTVRSVHLTDKIIVS